jgi:hypothetical protein
VAWFQAELERIAANTLAELNRQRQYHLDQAQLCDQVLQNLPATLFDKEKLLAFRDERRTQADFLTRHRNKWRFWRHYELLDLAKRVGIDLGYTSKPDADRVDESGNIVRGTPHGPGIEYLMAAATAIGAPVTASTARDLLQSYARSQISAALGGSGGLEVMTFILDKDGNVRP